MLNGWICSWVICLCLFVGVMSLIWWLLFLGNFEGCRGWDGILWLWYMKWLLSYKFWVIWDGCWSGLSCVRYCVFICSFLRLVVFMRVCWMFWVLCSWRFIICGCFRVLFVFVRNFRLLLVWMWMLCFVSLLRKLLVLVWRVCCNCWRKFFGMIFVMWLFMLIIFLLMMVCGFVVEMVVILFIWIWLRLI